MVELSVGEILPEFKYRFVFARAADKVFARLACRVGRTDRHSRERETIAQRIEWLPSSLAEEHMDFNLVFLDDFLQIMGRAGISVCIIEGHYNPLAPDDRTARLSVEVRSRLTDLAARSDWVTFVPRFNVYQFAEEECVDMTHVTPEAGRRFTQKVFALLATAP